MDPYPPPYEDVPAIQIYMGKDVRKCGMLRKKTGGKKIPFFQDQYDLRFVIINKGWVYYYKDKSSEKPQNKFSLQGFSNTVINAEEEEASRPYVFKIYSLKANERTWYFATETKLEMEQWMEAFRLEIEQYNVRGISNIRTSKSCPVKPLPGSQDFYRAGVNNDRPQSVHAPTPTQLNFPESRFSSQTDMTVTSGIGSSTQSFIEDDFYEPVDDCDDEFETDSESEEYLKPVHGQDSHPLPLPPFTHVSRETLFHKSEAPPALPPRDPVTRQISTAQDKTQIERNSIFEDLEFKFNPGPSSSSSSRLHLDSTPDSPKCHLPVFKERSWLASRTVPSALPPIPGLQPGLPEKVLLPHNPRNPPSGMHVRQRSEGSSVDRGHTASQHEQKRHSTAFSTIHEQLADQLASKLGQQPALLGQKHNARQRPWSMAPNIPDESETVTSGYKPMSPRQQITPHEKKFLHPLQEPPDHGRAIRLNNEKPSDLPSRPPPLPPGNSAHQWHNAPLTATSYGSSHMHSSPDHSSTSAKYGAPFSVPLSHPTNVPSQPPLPCKPMAFRTEGYISHNYDDTAHGQYDDNITEAGVYDVPEEESSYESACPVSEQSDNVMYEGEKIDKPLPPTPLLKPEKKPHPIPSLPLKPPFRPPVSSHKVDRVSETGTSWQSQPKSNVSVNARMTTATKQNNKPAWQVKLRSGTSPLADEADNKFAWPKAKLKSVEDSNDHVNSTHASKQTPRPPLAKMLLGNSAETGQPRALWRNEGSSGGAKSTAPTNTVGGLNSFSGARPPVAQKPKPPIASKPAPPVSAKPVVGKPPTPQKPKNSGVPSSNVAKLRDRFAQQ